MTTAYLLLLKAASFFSSHECFFLNFDFIGVYLIYNVVLVSSDSVNIYIYTHTHTYIYIYIYSFLDSFLIQVITE